MVNLIRLEGDDITLTQVHWCLAEPLKYRPTSGVALAWAECDHERQRTSVNMAHQLLLGSISIVLDHEYVVKS